MKVWAYVVLVICVGIIFFLGPCASSVGEKSDNSIVLAVQK